MLTWKGELADKNRRSSNSSIFQEDEVAPQISAVSLQQLENQVGYNVSSAYAAHTIQSSINDQNAEFANALNCREKLLSLLHQLGAVTFQ